MAAHDVFDRASAYEPYVGRWSRLLAPRFVGWLGAPGGKPWLDVGCGTGALTEAILAAARPALVCGVDPSADYVEHARAKVRDHRASFAVGDATALHFPDAAFFVAAAALVLNFVPDAGLAVAEMRRVVEPEGTVAAYVWDYAEGMTMMRIFWDAAVELDRTAASLDEGARFSICRPARLKACFESAGLAHVEVRELNVEMHFRDFDDFWHPFLGGQAPAPAYVASLDDDRRVAVRELIRSRLPIAAGGSIDMTSRAWAVRGTVPR